MFLINLYIFVIVNKNIYYVFWIDFFVLFFENKIIENDIFVNVIILICDYLDLLYGINFL